MKCWKKVTAALMAALALVGMTGCAKPSPGQLITGAQQRMAKVNSMRMSMDIKLELAEELSAVGLSMTMDADIIQKPEAKTKASLQINSFMDATVLEMYSWTQDGTQYVGISADGTNWQKTKAVGNPGASSAQALDPSQMGEMLNGYLHSLKNFVIEGEEQIEGKDLSLIHIFRNVARACAPLFFFIYAVHCLILPWLMPLLSRILPEGVPVSYTHLDVYKRQG